MKKSLILLAALALFPATPALAAQGDIWIGPQFGGSVPTGEFTKSANSGFEGGLVGTFFESKRVGVGVDVAYHLWSGSGDADAFLAVLLGPGWKAKLNAIQTTARVLYDFGTAGKARPYAKAGFGLYWVKTTLYSPSGIPLDLGWQPNFGYNVGAGVNLNVSPMFDIGIGGTYHNIQATGPDASLYTFDVNLIWGRRAK